MIKSGFLENADFEHIFDYKYSTVFQFIPHRKIENITESTFLDFFTHFISFESKFCVENSKTK